MGLHYTRKLSTQSCFYMYIHDEEDLLELVYAYRQDAREKKAEKE